MCKFIGKSNGRILCKLSRSEISRLYTIVYVAMETTKTSHFTCQSKSFISIFFICQVSACELQPFSCHDLANDIYSKTDKPLFSHLVTNVLIMNKKIVRMSGLKKFIMTKKSWWSGGLIWLKVIKQSYFTYLTILANLITNHCFLWTVSRKSKKYCISGRL